jgi:hypothetical protein
VADFVAVWKEDLDECGQNVGYKEDVVNPGAAILHKSKRK